MSRFFVTFGGQYSREPHPRFGAADPDGWFEIEAPDYMAARELAVRDLGTAWCWLYDEDSFEPHYFPRGRLFLLTTEPEPAP